MANVLIAPSKYVQGKNELENLGSHIVKLGKKSLVLISASGKKRFGEIIEKSLKDSNVEVVVEIFNGECSKGEIDRVSQICKDANCDNVIGVGGGKILDTAKAVAFFNKTPVASIPTIASTDAPCSAVVVVYTEEGIVDDYMFLPKNPDLVLVDLSVIVNTPVRLTVSGMGDALATYFEARACSRSNAMTCAGGTAPMAALAIAKLCYETLLDYGYSAKVALEQKVCTKAVENIVEANTLLSGLGFESGGVAAAHSIHDGFTILEQCHHMYHGEKVSFGTIAQLVLENAPMEEIEQVIYFCKSVGLPTNLKDLGIEEIKEQEIMAVSKAATAEGSLIHNMPFKVTAEDVYAAILVANQLGE